MSRALPSIRINSVEIPVKNAAASAEWYGRCLGLVTAWSDKHHALLESAPANGADAPRVLLVETDDDARLAFRSTHRRIDHSVIDFITDDLEGMHAHLRASGAEVGDLGPPANDWAPRGFAFQDPDGNRLGVFAYGG